MGYPTNADESVLRRYERGQKRKLHNEHFSSETNDPAPEDDYPASEGGDPSSEEEYPDSEDGYPALDEVSAEDGYPTFEVSSADNPASTNFNLSAENSRASVCIQTDLTMNDIAKNTLDK